MKQAKNNISQTVERPNLFASAKKVDPKKEAKSKMLSLPVTPELEQQLKEYTEAKSQSKNWEAKLKMSEGIIKDKARELYLNEYKKQGRNIGSFKLGDVTVSVQDRYTKMDDDMASIVEQNFPDAIEKCTEYLLNQEILRKHIDKISDALQMANGIPAEDLAALIEVKEVTAVKKGTIDTLATYGDKMGDLFQAISPIISMR